MSCLSGVGERYRAAMPVVARPPPTGAVLPALRQGVGGASVINASVINPRPPKGAAASPLAPTPSAHDEEHRVVVAEEHLPE